MSTPWWSSGATLAVFMLTALPAAAQERHRDRDRDRHDDGRGFFQAGLLALDLDAMNAALGDADYPSLDGDVLTLGGGGFGVRGRFLIGGEGHGILGSDEDTPDGARRLALHGGYGLFKVGWIALEESGLELVPMVGIGGGGLTLQIKERGAPTFDDVLEDPERSATLSSGTFLMEASLGASFRIRLERDDDEGGEGGILLGLQAGWLFAPGSASWTLDGLNDVAGGPDTRLEGLYLRGTIGGWGRGGRR